MAGRRNTTEEKEAREREAHAEDEIQHEDPAADASEEDPISQLERERDEARDRYKRALADYQNYQRRALINEREAREEGLAAALQSMLSVIDHFDLALKQDPEAVSAAQIIDGVKLIKGEFMRAIAEHGVTPINPEPNDELDPHFHQAVLQQQAEGVEPGRIAMTLQPGYRMGDRVLRPAQVAVSPAEG